jgi:hypothetical protein
MLDVHMVPPIAERNMQGKNGAAVVLGRKRARLEHRALPRGPEPSRSKQLTRPAFSDRLVGIPKHSRHAVPNAKELKERHAVSRITETQAPRDTLDRLAFGQQK